MKDDKARKSFYDINIKTSTLIINLLTSLVKCGLAKHSRYEHVYNVGALSILCLKLLSKSG